MVRAALTHLLVTIDVECDKSPRWHCADPLSFRGVTEAIPELLQPLFARYGVRPTYLLSPEVLADDGCVEVLRNLTDVELGSHLHGEYIGPEPRVQTVAGSLSWAMQGDYPPEIERGKLAALTELFRKRIGYSPTSFRAGRFGIGHDTGRWLFELGYLVDSSVVPHVCLRNPANEERPDFRACPELPYWTGLDHDLFTPGPSSLLEVPVTVLAEGVLPTAHPMWPGAQCGGPTWFRPFYSDAQTLLDIIRIVGSEDSGRPLVMMFHNIEVVPNASPYSRSEAEVTRYLSLLDTAMRAATDAGFRPVTLSEYEQEFRQTAAGT
jgi:hypothetical protein